MSQTVKVSVRRKGSLSPVRFARAMSRLSDPDQLPDAMSKAFFLLLVRNINENAYGFELSAFWKRVKKLKGWDDRPFIASGAYVENISISVRKGRWVVGFPEGQEHPTAGMTYGQLALLLEYGRMDKGLVARPLWRNTIREFFGLMTKQTKVTLKKLMRDARRI